MPAKQPRMLMRRISRYHIILWEEVEGGRSMEASGPGGASVEAFPVTDMGVPKCGKIALFRLKKTAKDIREKLVQVDFMGPAKTIDVNLTIVY